MNAQKTLSIIVPVYYNAASLPELFNRICTVEQALHERGMGVELIFVDDGSRDSSWEGLCAIKESRPETKLIKLARNFGELAATGAGFANATGDCIAVLAADLQEPPEQILPMVEAWEQGAQLVFCNRRSRQDPFVTRLLAGIYYKLLNALVAKNYPEGGVDMVLMDSALLPYVLPLPAGVSHSLYLFMLGFEATLLPYDREARRHGKSRWTFKKKFRYFLDTITGFSITPLRIITATGLAGSLLSLAYGVEWMMHAVAVDVDTPSYVMLVTLLGFFAGIIIAMLGIIGEYLWRIFAIISQHPKSVIAKAYLTPD